MKNMDKSKQKLTMTPRERFEACMRFEPMDRPPLREWPPWESTIEQWTKETGLSKDKVLSYLNEQDREELVRVDFSMIPPFVEKIVAENEKTVTRRDRMGITFREFKNDPLRSMPEWIEPPVKTRRDWDDIKNRLDPLSPQRYPSDWEIRIVKWKKQRPLLRFYNSVASYYGGPSLFGFIRMLLGDEMVHYAFYDEPDMVEDMLDTAMEFFITVLRKVLSEAPVTVVQFWEDMCCKTGSLISPAMFRRLLIPRYKQITEVIHSAGVDIIFVDSDGKVDELLPLWLEVGINGVFPMEQAAGCDIHAYRKRYGRDLLMTGGIDKRALALGTEAIDRELESKIPLAFEGGYIPTLDHSIPPDVTYKNFMYYWMRKKEMLGV
jgi:hypothetical protein